MERDLGTREGAGDTSSPRPPPDDQQTQAWPGPVAPGGEQRWARATPGEERWPGAPRAEPPRAEPSPRDADPAAAPTQRIAPTPAPPAEVAPATRQITPRPAGEAEGRPAVMVRRLRRGRLAIRKIDPWAVLKFSLVFYFCMLLIFMLGTAVIFATLKAFGVIDNIEEVLRNLQINYTISGGAIFRWFFLFGIAGTLVASAITVFLAFLYNLIADVVGGIELLVTERE